MLKAKQYKEQARAILETMLQKFADIGIKTSPKKTNIVKLSRGFTFLKTQFSYSDTGKIIARPSRQSAARQRRKLKKFKKFYDAGEMNLTEIRSSYMSRRGYIGHINSRRTVRNMDGLYKGLFGVSPLKK